MNDTQNQKAEELRRLASQLRRHADESALPDYATKLRRSAEELEAQAETLSRPRQKTH
jgi:methyl-accepting chemotaxis protein